MKIWKIGNFERKLYIANGLSFDLRIFLTNFLYDIPYIFNAKIQCKNLINTRRSPNRVEYRSAISISLSIFGIPSAQSPSIDPRNPATRSTCVFAQIKPTSYAHLRVHKSNKTNCKRACAFVTPPPC